MAANVYVTISGPALSFLLYENIKCLGDQTGFLLGEVVSHVTDTISDSQIRSENTETLISINSLIAIPESLFIFNGVGRIKKEKLKEILNDKEKEVVGWYSYRRNTVLEPHLREKLLHKEFLNALPHMSADHFAMCLLTTSMSADSSTHTFRHKFVRYRHIPVAFCNGIFEALSVQIQNLGETPQSEYQVFPSTSCLSKSFHDIVASLESSISTSDVNLVLSIHQALQLHLAKLVKQVVHSGEQLLQLETEVDELQSRPGSIPHEILLPQLLNEPVPPSNVPVLSTPELLQKRHPLASTPNSATKLKPRESVKTPLKIPNPEGRLKNPESARKLAQAPKHHPISGARSKPVGPPRKLLQASEEKLKTPSPDPFAYVNEMKIEMSKPVENGHARKGSSEVIPPAISYANALKRKEPERQLSAPPTPPDSETKEH